jgi:hypothetical protein
MKSSVFFNKNCEVGGLAILSQIWLHVKEENTQVKDKCYMLVIC